MPPRSYVITALVVAILVAISIPLTMGFSVIVWYALFSAAAVILAVGGILRLLKGLQAPTWIGFAIASPILVWAANWLYEIPFLPTPESAIIFGLASVLAFAAAGIGVLRLTEILSEPHPAFRVGYGLILASALLIFITILARSTGMTFANSTLYTTSIRVLAVSTAIVRYGAVIAATVLISLRYNIERWAGAAIALIAAFMLYRAVIPRSFLNPGPSDGMLFWLQPVLMLIAAAAIWRMGSVLQARLVQEQIARA